MRLLTTGLVTLCTAVVVSGCSALGPSGQPESGPPRISPRPRPDVAAAMAEQRPAPEMRLNACELLDLTPTQVIALADVDLPDVEPTGSGDLGLLCTYGGPGSPERYEAKQAESPTESTESSESLPSEQSPTTSTTTSTPSSDSDEVADPADIPDTVAAGVIKPRSGSRAALAGQAAMLGVRFACSEVRGEDAASVEGGAPAAPGAPVPVRPELGSAYIDCVAAPTGGGVEVHTILVADDDLWHLTLISPRTPRSPESESRALAGLHRIAEQILG